MILSSPTGTGVEQGKMHHDRNLPEDSACLLRPMEGTAGFLALKLTKISGKDTLLVWVVLLKDVEIKWADRRISINRSRQKAYFLDF
jgi:hypothetical protein